MSVVMSACLLGQTVRAVPTPATKRASTVVYAADRPVWLPGVNVPSHLNRTLPGDYGFDPLGLGAEPEALKWFVQAELVHCRFAMLGVAGILIPGLLTKVGILNVPNWYEAGKVAIESQPLGLNFPTLLGFQLFMMTWAETKRWVEFKNPGSQSNPDSYPGAEMLPGKVFALGGSGDVNYPGGLFNPMNMGDDSMKVKEIANGRLAMLAFLGFIAQYYATGKGPIDNWFDHLSDPWANNFATNGVSVPFL
eukprot:TRINITY_DN11697_c0_g1_i1.p2 TRINITY_DN11697_c0_g1~~TRINITY_DN11697_c0_g1_i1.p2  ORF type:complete len:250 (-),score=71.19 TRINITY_DN11697_c0_g1_i1:351-1100(-)